MQLSIYKIFGSIKTLITLMLLLTTLLAVTLASEYSSFNKLKKLQQQKELVVAVYNLSRDDLDLANIQFRGKNTQLKHNAEDLAGIYEFDYINKFTDIGNYTNELTKLKYAINDFNVASGDWYAQEEPTEAELLIREEQFTKTYTSLLLQINAVISNNMAFEERRFRVEGGLMLALLLIILFASTGGAGRLNKVQNDIRALHRTEGEDLNEFSTVEADVIYKHFGRTIKAPTAQNPAYLDSLTSINSNKGFVHEYGEKKSLKLGNYTAVCIFSIDKLNEIEMQYPQEFTETILKKTSFMLSLYRQHNDIIGRLEHNQFAILLSRQDKTSAINDCELIRKSVEETPFKTPNGTTINVTLSGGFVQKMSTQVLGEIITKANKVLSMSVQHGGNRIAQLRDKSTALK